MLVSHRKQFIFTKTVKTAGTSVESYFEPYCMPEGEWQICHTRDEYVSDTGIIGYRGINLKNTPRFYNHMPAKDIRQMIGHDVWNRYYKFTVIRNPYEKLVSGFKMREKDKESYALEQKLKVPFKRLLGCGDPIDRIKGKSEVERFRHWVKIGGTVADRDKYLIDGELCVDFFIKQEDLNNGIQRVCNHLAIAFEPQRIPEFKKGLRNEKLKTSDYYDEETRRIVQESYKWELEYFGYTFPINQ